jgi:hypothetical protein
MFDPNAFFDQVVESAGSTEVVPIPAGEYLATIDKKEVTQWSKKDDPSISGLKLKVTWSLEDQPVRDLLGRDKVTVVQDILLDLTDHGTLDMGKGRNVELNRLRAAVDLNVSGFSFNQLDGRMARVTVKQDQDRNDPSKFYARVKAVGHA